jgi:uncharacterized protein
MRMGSPNSSELVQLVPPGFIPGDWALECPRLALEPVRKPVEVVPLTGIWRLIYVIIGLFFVGMSYLGAVLPGLPTTPWVLLASYCFGRSSPRLQRWLLRSPFFGKLITDWQAHQGIRPRVKAFAASMVLIACSFSITFAPIPLWVKFCIGCCGFIGFCVILFIVPTISEENSPGKA